MLSRSNYPDQRILDASVRQDFGTLHIQALLHARLTETVGYLGRLQLHGLVTASRWSRVFRGEYTNHGSIAVKLCLDPTTGQPAAKSARAYFAALQHMADLARVELPLRAATPLYLFDDLGLVVTTWIDGPTLQEQLDVTSPAAVYRDMERAGQWLASFHQAAGTTQRVLDTAQMLCQVDEAAYYATWPGTTKTVRRAFGLLRRTAQAIGAQEVPYGWTYGDFKPSNLIVAENRLVAIDMDLRFREACMIDAAQFCNHVALYVPFAFIPTRIGLRVRAKISESHE